MSSMTTSLHILNVWSQEWNQYHQSWQSGVTNTLKSIIFTELEDYIREIYDYEWAVILLTKSLQFWISEDNNDPGINILDNVESIITQNSIRFSELDYYRHKYLRLCVSYVFNDNKLTIMNKWSQQWFLYQHSRQSGVNNDTSINILDKVESIITQDSMTFTELEYYGHKYLRLCVSCVFDDQ